MAFLVEMVGAAVELAAKTLSMACASFIFDESKMPEELIK